MEPTEKSIAFFDPLSKKSALARMGLIAEVFLVGQMILVIFAGIDYHKENFALLFFWFYNIASGLVAVLLSLFYLKLASPDVPYRKAKLIISLPFFLILPLCVLMLPTSFICIFISLFKALFFGGNIVDFIQTLLLFLFSAIYILAYALMFRLTILRKSENPR